MPVYNGEKYLREALDSILVQTYNDFELIISDNKSTDSTEQICRKYAVEDRRIRYFRNKKNIGVPKNFNRTFELSSGEFFMWATHDDLHSTEYLQKCVRILDKNPSIVLCHSITGRIDKHGILRGVYNQGLLKRIDSAKPHERFGDLIDLYHYCCLVMGLARASSLRKTSLIASYIGSDRNLLAELGLMGKIYRIPEYLFYQRDHPDSYSSNRSWPYTTTTPIDSLIKEMAWWSKDNWTSFPHWKTCIEYFRSVNRVSLKCSERLLCYNQIFLWIMKQGWYYMLTDIKIFLLRSSSFAHKFIPFVAIILRQLRHIQLIIKKLSARIFR
jgi:glycosyltransferase involved in cell wall biosynthesis